MEKINFNRNWYCTKSDRESFKKKVDLPHDAMLSEKRADNNPGGRNISWFEGGEYIYTKDFELSSAYSKKLISFEFEGAYQQAEVYINDNLIVSHPYGYTTFYVQAENFLTFNDKNEIKVIVKNNNQPNSRWYTGSGIYRDVNMIVTDKEHIIYNSLKIKTISLNPTIIEITIELTDSGEVSFDFLLENKSILKVNKMINKKKTFRCEIPEAKLWDDKNPNIYECQAVFNDDIVTETFGIRTLDWDHSSGLVINGKRVILRGACIHSDNGILGACSYVEAEERKVKLLKETGYNAIRMAHNPCSKSILEVCDQLGMYVIDEYVDMWYIHKTKYDYVEFFDLWWQQDLTDMVVKNYNHPSCIMYSIGNEVSETSQPRGIKLVEEMTTFLNHIDTTRPVTCGINIFFNLLSSLGFGVYTDKKAEDETKAVGSEFYNNLAGLLGDKTMKIGATLYGCDKKTRESFANLNIAGYNYGILRYKKDLKKYPHRLILGTETFCSDTYQFWELAKKNKRIIGDFVWTGIDYLGEAGIGAWEYKDYADSLTPQLGWLTAGSGRIDITGKANGEAAYTKIAYEQTNKPSIAVRPVYQKGRHSHSAWKLTDAIMSWTWEGCEGMKAVVEVYSRAYEVALFINKKMVGKKKFKNDCRFIFKTTYEPGTLKAICYNKYGEEINTTQLITAQSENILQILPEQKTIKSGRILFIRLKFTDKKGNLKPMVKELLKVKVSGGELLGLGNGCSYNNEGYLNDYTYTYYGEALAVVKHTLGSKIVKVSVSSSNQTKVISIPVTI